MSRLEVDPSGSVGPDEEGRARAPRPGSGEMFDGIAHRYDLLNRVLSLGMDRRWRRLAVDAMGLGDKARVLDLATGTADLAISLLERHPCARLTGLDPSQAMLALARDKMGLEGLPADLLRGDAGDLPFSDHSFDGVTIGFGIRNFPDRLRALQEIVRVLVPGGKLAILELIPPGGGPLGPLSRFWVRAAVPWIGARLSGGGAYRYLEQSVSAFPSPDVFAETMVSAGLKVTLVRPLGFGACCLFVAEA